MKERSAISFTARPMVCTQCGFTDLDCLAEKVYLGPEKMLSNEFWVVLAVALGELLLS